MRPGLFGQAITAEQVAGLPAESGPTALVRVCGVLIGAALGDRIGSFTLPEISERIRVPDGGVDARYAAPDSLEVPETGGLIGPGRTVFQFKYRDVTRGRRDALVAELARSVRRDLTRASPSCDRYVLLTNLDLTASDRKRLAGAIGTRLPALRTPPVIWGAAEIALQLNSLPRLRSLLVSGGALCTLDFAAEELRSAYRSLGWPTLQGREAEIAAIASFAAEPMTRLLTVFGPPYVGKTRLVVEALRPRASLVVWSATPEGASLDLFRDLDSEDREVILVIDRCDVAAAWRLAGHARERQHLKTLLIVEGVADGPGAAEDRAIHLSPLGEDEALRLVRELAPGVTFRQASWTVEIAGGLPGLLVHAAALVGDGGGQPADTGVAVRGRLASLVAEHHLRGLDTSQRQALRVLALLPVVGASEGASRELDAVARALGTTGDLVRRQLSDLRETGLVRRRGRFLEVLPPVLGDQLAREALADPGRLIEELVLTLEPGAFLRFLERLRDVDAPEVRRAISELLSPHGWFPNLAALARNARQLRALAPAAPREALGCLERILKEASGELLANELASDARRAVVTTLEDLALRADTFEGAAQLLLVLADAENETWGNNATGVFTQLFHWGHPEVPASLTLRGDILGRAARDGAPRRRALVARACGAAFRPRAIGLHRALGPAAPEPAYRPTRDEVVEYGLALLEVVGTLLADPEAPVRDAARAAAVHAFRPCVHGGLLPDGLHSLALQAFACIERVGRYAAGAWERARVVTELELLIEELETPPPPAHLASEPGRSDAVARAELLVRELTEPGLRDRLWQWVGPGSHRAEQAWLNTPAEALARLGRIAAELAAAPSTLREHLSWLTGDEAVHRHHLFRGLGEIDDAGRAWAVIVDDPTGRHWAEAFAAYCVGRAARDEVWVERELDRTVTDPGRLRGVILATSWLLPGKTNLDRLVRIAGSESVERVDVAREVALGAAWREMPPPEAERLLRALDDGTAQVREALLRPILVLIRAHGDQGPSLRDLAWSFLETVGSPIRREQPRTWDSLAATLGVDEPHRLRAVLAEKVEHLLRRGEPLSLADDLPLSWKTLKAKDPRGALEVVLHAATLPNAWSVADELLGLIDPARDRDRLVQWLRDTGAGGLRLLTSGLDPDRPGFWQLVPDLLLSSPDEEETGEILVDRLHAGSWSGSATRMIDRRLAEARKLERHEEARVRTWARRAVTSLEAWRRREEREEQEPWIWDYRIHRADLETILRKADSAERLWAIRRLLEDAPERRVRELLTPAEILAALPNLPHLDRATRDKWETWARHHAGSSQRD